MSAACHNRWPRSTVGGALADRIPQLEGTLEVTERCGRSDRLCRIGRGEQAPRTPPRCRPHGRGGRPARRHGPLVATPRRTAAAALRRRCGAGGPVGVAAGRRTRLRRAAGGGSGRRRCRRPASVRRSRSARRLRGRARAGRRPRRAAGGSCRGRSSRPHPTPVVRGRRDRRSRWRSGRRARWGWPRPTGARRRARW